MKKTVAFIGLLLLTISCKDSYAEKPKNLIEENKMVNILTDVSILAAIRVKNPASLDKKNIKSDQYIYQKYKIDSSQFASSNKYYAADVDKYAKMYEKVTQNIDKRRKEADSLIAKGINVGPPKPKVELTKEQKVMRFNRLFQK